LIQRRIMRRLAAYLRGYLRKLTMYRHLLVPVDDTDLSVEVVGNAVALARRSAHASPSSMPSPMPPACCAATPRCCA
jgi:hypothetical protein